MEHGSEAGRSCPRCSARNPANAWFCGACGWQLVCTACERPAANGDRYCASCGRPLERPGESAPSAPPVAPPAGAGAAAAAGAPAAAADAPAPGRPRLPHPVAAFAGAVILAATLLPWVHANGRAHHAFDVGSLFLSAGRATRDAPIGAGLVLLGALAFVPAVWSPRSRENRAIAGVLAVGCGILAAAIAVGFLARVGNELTSDAALLQAVGPGPYVTLAGAALLVIRRLPMRHAAVGVLSLVLVAGTVVGLVGPALAEGTAVIRGLGPGSSRGPAPDGRQTNAVQTVEPTNEPTGRPTREPTEVPTKRPPRDEPPEVAPAYRVTANPCLRIRTAPSRSAQPMGCVDKGFVLPSEGTSEFADGVWWIQVYLNAERAWGWGAADFLEPADDAELSDY